MLAEGPTVQHAEEEGRGLVPGPAGGAEPKQTAACTGQGRQIRPHHSRKLYSSMINHIFMPPSKKEGHIAMHMSVGLYVGIP